MPTTFGDLRMFVDGNWIESEDSATVAAINPATGEVIASVPAGTRADASRAVESAHRNAYKMASMSVWDRSRACERIADAMLARRDELARALSIDQGKPLVAEAYGEVDFAIEGFRSTAEQVKWLETAVTPVEAPNKRVMSFRRPRGVYAIVTPWNFPINIPCEYIAPALATGNAFVWVPAPTTTVCAVMLMECIVAADIPEGVANLVIGAGPVVGDEIVGHPLTDAVGFTGSSATGLHIARRAAGKPMLLELGGNGPTIVFPDADLDRSAAAIAFSCFWNAGQVCNAGERILVHESVREDLADRLVGHANEIRLGDPMNSNTTMGPLNNDPVAAKVDRHIDDAVNRGSRVVAGGTRANGLGSQLYYQPTVIDGVTEDALINHEETFGPVAPLTPFTTEAEAIRLANATTHGLASAIFTKDLATAYRVTESIRAGVVTVNDHSTYWESHIPFGGVAGKESGVGRIGGRHAIAEMSDLRTMCIDIGAA